MSEQGAGPRESSQEVSLEERLGRFLGEPTRSLDDWHWLFSTDTAFPVSSHRAGVFGRVLVAVKRMLRPWVRLPQQDLWDRQRVFNLIAIEELRRISDLRTNLQAVDARLRNLETCFEEGLREIARYNDALYSRVDLKLDRALEETRRQQRDIGAIADSLSDAEPTSVLADKVAQLRDASYVAFEDRYRGSEDDIDRRVATYVDELSGHSPVVDIGCGRGELLRLLDEAGVEARGIDGNAAMVRRCVEDHGLDVVEADLLAGLRACEPESVGAVVCLHVVEHLESPILLHVLDAAFRALRSGGLLLIETPNPLSLVAGSRNFWRDATHLKPVHPDQLAMACRSAGFGDVGFETLHPFPAKQRLPDVVPAPAEGSAEQDEFFRRLAKLRDALDELLYGDQDYVLRATKP